MDRNNPNQDNLSLLKQKQRRWNMIIVGCIVLIILWISAPVTRRMYPMVFPTYPDLPEVSRRTNLTFPKSAKLTNSYLYPCVQDRPLIARIEMTPEDADRFVSALLPKAVEKSRDKECLQIMKRYGCSRTPWWKIGTPHKFLYLAVPGQMHRVYVIVDQDDRNKTVVFIESDVYS